MEAIKAILILVTVYVVYSVYTWHGTDNWFSWPNPFEATIKHSIPQWWKEAIIDQRAQTDNPRDESQTYYRVDGNRCVEAGRYCEGDPTESPEVAANCGFVGSGWGFLINTAHTKSAKTKPVREWNDKVEEDYGSGHYGLEPKVATGFKTPKLCEDYREKYLNDNIVLPGRKKDGKECWSSKILPGIDIKFRETPVKGSDSIICGPVGRGENCSHNYNCSSGWCYEDKRHFWQNSEFKCRESYSMST